MPTPLLVLLFVIAFMIQARAVAAVKMAESSTSTTRRKTLWILRHGQATHNPRAEAARAQGCSWEEFFELMRQDDSLDAPLTDHGRQQAVAVQEQHGARLERTVQLVVSSPLSRALETANLALSSSSSSTQNRVCYEGFREINGVLRNAQRLSLTQLRAAFPDWKFEDDHFSSDHDDAWDAETLESTDAVAERGVAGLRWLLHQRSEENLLLVAHGGLLRYTMEHAHCLLRDERRNKDCRPVSARFGNCELRRYRLESIDEDDDDDASAECVVLTEVDLLTED